MVSHKEPKIGAVMFGTSTSFRKADLDTHAYYCWLQLRLCKRKSSLFSLTKKVAPHGKTGLNQRGGRGVAVCCEIFRIFACTLPANNSTSHRDPQGTESGAARASISQTGRAESLVNLGKVCHLNIVGCLGQQMYMGLQPRSNKCFASAGSNGVHHPWSWPRAPKV